MFQWLKRKSAAAPDAVKPDLDFTEPNPQKFEHSVAQWRSSLESKRAQDNKLDQNNLKFMRQDVLDDLAAKESRLKKEALAKKRAERKIATATAAKKPAAKKTTAKSAASGAATKSKVTPTAKAKTSPTKKTAPASAKPAVKKPTTKNAK